MQVRYIISTKSGSKDRSAFLRKLIIKVHEDAEETLPNIVLTERKNHVQYLAKEWSELHGKEGLVYICGGDGSINECANALYGSECYMGVVPFGTGNDFAKTFYPRRINQKILKEIIEASIRPNLGKIDLLKVNDKYSINVVSMGFDTVILRTAYKIIARFPKIGKLAYGLSVLLNLGARKQFEYMYSLSGPETKVESKGIASLAVFANARYYGSGFMPTPTAKVNDGLGNALISERLNIIDVLTTASKYQKGKHLDHKKLHSYTFTEAKISSIDHRKILANYDGKIFETYSINFKLINDALNFAYINL